MLKKIIKTSTAIVTASTIVSCANQNSSSHTASETVDFSVGESAQTQTAHIYKEVADGLGSIFAQAEANDEILDNGYYSASVRVR